MHLFKKEDKDFLHHGHIYLPRKITYLQGSFDGVQKTAKSKLLTIIFHKYLDYRTHLVRSQIGLSKNFLAFYENSTQSRPSKKYRITSNEFSGVEMNGTSKRSTVNINQDAMKMKAEKLKCNSTAYMQKVNRNVNY